MQNEREADVADRCKSFVSHETSNAAPVRCSALSGISALAIGCG
jgi:hypothetical protein